MRLLGRLTDLPVIQNSRQASMNDRLYGPTHAERSSGGMARNHFRQFSNGADLVYVQRKNPGDSVVGMLGAVPRELKSRCRMQTILVSDDDETLRDTMGVLLDREGFKVIFAPDGRKGLHEAALGKVGLILADLRLPDISGFEICKRIRTSGIRTRQ
jgi:hypothetical protein